MRIAHLASVDFIHYRLLLPQLRAIRDAGHEAIAISADGPFVQLLEAEGIQHIALDGSTRSFDLRSDIRSMRSLWQILRTKELDLLHTHNPKPGVYGRIIGRLAGVPAIVSTCHGLYATPEDRFLRKAIVYSLEATASRFSDYELIQSVEDYELLTRTWMTRPSRTILLGNGIDLDRFDSSRFSNKHRENLKARLQLDPSKPIVGIVARLVHEKGLREFITSATEMSSSHTFVVVGASEPQKSDALGDIEIAEAKRVGVVFLGPRTDVDEILSILDVFALPSYREGLPRAAMEAAASGIPVVATDIRGCRQVVDHGRTGLLVPLRDSKALTHAIQTITSDPSLAAAMGKASRDKAVREFDEAHVLETVARVHALALRRRR